ncbi:MAG: hypothetical protein ACKVVT_03445 [Dehalococcoidia bacterium]
MDDVVIEVVPNAFRRTWAYTPSGVPVWAIIGQLQGWNWDIEAYLERTCGEITRADVDFAIAYYKKHRGEIDLKLSTL